MIRIDFCMKLLVPHFCLSSIVPDPGRIDPDPEPTFKKKPGSTLKKKPAPDPTLKIGSGSNLFLFFDMKVNSIDILSGKSRHGGLSGWI